MYKILKNTIEMDDYSVQKLSNQPPEPFEWNIVEGTELNVNDCIGGKGKIEVKGNTEQEQLSGKNLFGISDYEKTYNGVQIKIKDGEITLNGTCTGTGTVYIGPKNEQILNGTYTISRNSISGTMSGSGNINLRNVSDDSIISGTQMSLTINSRTFTLENANVEYGIYLMRDATFDNYKFRPQLVEGDTPDYDFEPYCGGQPSPNPDYPQEIKVVTGDNVVKHVGKNLLNMSNGITNNGISTSLKEDGSINIKGTTNAEWFNMTLGSGKRTKIRLLPGTYTFSVNEALNFSLRIKAYYKNYPAEYFHITINPRETSGTFKVPRECDNFYLYAFGLTAGTVIDLNVKLQLEEGSTATSYEPYRGEKYEVYLPSLNKNILDTRYTKLGSVNAETGEYVYNPNNLMGENYIKVEPNTTYCLSGNTTFSGIRLSEYDENKTHIKRSQSNSPAVVITTTANTHYVRWSFNYNSQPVDINLAKTLELQLELGNLRTSFIECEPLELCKIDDHEDIPFKNVVGDENYNSSLTEGAWYKKNKVIKKIYVDNDNWVSYVNANNLVYFGLPLSATPAGNNILANYFTKISSLWTLSSYVDAIQISGNLQNILLMKKDCTTVEQLKLWLASHNLEVYYALQTPTYTQITNPTLISQLEALRKAKWFKGVNHWFTETENLDPVLKGTYRQAINE